MSGILLAGVNKGQHFYGIGSDLIDEDIVGMNDRLTRARSPAGA